MRHDVTHEDLMRFLDGELAADRRARVEEHVAACTECRRELTIFGDMKGELETMRFTTEAARESIWDAIGRRIVRPAGWTLLLTGVLAWTVYAVYMFVTDPGDPWEKLVTGAVWIGFLLLLADVAWERYRDWQNDPYKDIER